MELMTPLESTGLHDIGLLSRMQNKRLGIKCPKCASANVSQYTADAWQIIELTPGTYHCHSCGHAFPLHPEDIEE